MPRKCTICAHKKRSAIDKALVERQPFRNIVEQFRVSLGALARHSDDHLPASLVKAQQAKEAADADALLAQIVGLRDEGLGVLEKAKDAEDLHTVLNAIKVTQGTIELLAKLAKCEPRSESPSIAECATVFRQLEMLSGKSRLNIHIDRSKKW